MKFRLKRLGAEPTLVEQVVNQFEGENLLNDEKFAAWWVAQRCQFRPKGNMALKSELMQKGVDSSVIAGVLLSPEQEKMLARDLVNRRNWADRDTITARLFSRGFSASTVSAIIDEKRQEE